MSDAIANRKKVGNFVRVRMDTLDLKVKDLADGVKLPANFLSMIRNGQSNVPLNVVVSMAKMLDVDPNEFAQMVLPCYSLDILGFMAELQAEDNITDHERGIIKHIRLHAGGKKVRYTKTCAPELEVFVNAALGR